MKNFFSNNTTVFIFGVSLALLLLILKWIEYRFLIISHRIELYAGLIAIFFTALGIWISFKVLGNKTKTIVVEKEIFVPNPLDFERRAKALEDTGLSNREMEVLELMAKGLSNQEMAEQLFVSLNTIKTHNSKILSKLDVKRRTQAIEKAKRLSLIK
jgi:DNA-binding CsgD family transcriptional regulator